MARHRFVPTGPPVPRSVRSRRQRHRHGLTRAQRTTRQLTAAGVLGYAAATLLYTSAFGVGLDGFRPQPGAAPADAGGLAAAGASRAADGQPPPVRTPSQLYGPTGNASGSEPSPGVRGSGPSTRAGLPPTADKLLRNPRVSTAVNVRAPDALVEAVTGPVVRGRMQPARVLPPKSGDGSYQIAPGHDKASVAHGGRVIRYRVEVERGLPFDAADFAADVHRILNDPRGWGRNGRLGFERVDHGGVQLIISLSSPRLTDAQCAPLRTLGRVSCWNGDRAVINARRWGIGARTYGRDLLSYREYLINHEVGHGLGEGHARCPHPGWRAPVMVQQTISLEGCRSNPWPHPSADRAG